MNTKYQVFISSTFVDLVEQREQVLKTVLKMGHLPVGMEMFNAADQTQWEVIKRHIDNSDYYLVVIAHRYGSIDEAGVSFTEKEYDYARSKGIPCLAFVINDSVNWPPKNIDSGLAKKSLQKFKIKVKNTLVNHWDSTDNLAFQVLSSLTDTITISPRVGWVRANEAAASPQVLEEMSRLSKENNELKMALSTLSEKKDDIEEALTILKGIKFEIKLKDNSVYSSNYAFLFKDYADKLLTEIPSNYFEHIVNEEMRKLDVTDFKEVRIILNNFMQNIEMLDLTLTTLNNSSEKVRLTSKGKAALTRTKHFSDD